MSGLSRRAVVLLAVAVVVLAGLATTGTWLATRSWSAEARSGYPGGYGPGMMRGGYGPGGYGAGGYGPGMMGGGYGPGGYSGHAGAVGSTPDDRQVALGNQVPAGATVDRTTRTVRFTGPTAAMVFVASPEQGPDMAYRMAGLTNPTVVVPAGATVRVTLVNADESMYHDWLVTGAAPPYPAMGVMMAGVSFPGAATAMLGFGGDAGMPTQTISFTAGRAGSYHYLCAYPGHAARGMYGALIVGNP